MVPTRANRGAVGNARFAGAVGCWGTATMAGVIGAVCCWGTARSAGAAGKFSAVTMAA